MIRKLILLYFMFLQFYLVKGQDKLSGTYEYYLGDASGSFGLKLDFLSESTFKYYAFQCMSHQIGNGKYKIEKNTLVLKFIRTDSLENIIKTTKTNSINDIVTINLYVKHLDKPKDSLQERESVFIEIKNGIKDSLILEPIDSNGNYQLKLPSSNKTISIEIGDDIYYKKAKIITTLQHGLNSEILLAPFCYECTDLKELKYKIIENKKDRLIVTNNGKKFLFEKVK
jgi:hypothetical protein